MKPYRGLTIKKSKTILCVHSVGKNMVYFGIVDGSEEDLMKMDIEKFDKLSTESLNQGAKILIDTPMNTRPPFCKKCGQTLEE